MNQILLNTVLLSLLAAQAPARAEEIGSFAVSSTDFKDLYNTQQTGQPRLQPWAGSYWPYSEQGIAATTVSGQTLSPAAKFDQFFNLGTTTADWEKSRHTCDNLDPSTAQECRGWWGHCNAWSAAGVKEPEPRAEVTVDGTTFTVADQKAYLTEMWMESGSLFAGTTDKGHKTGGWVLDPKDPISQETDQWGTTRYEAFWDVTPRNFFLLFTNYLGILKLGVIVDRFTGDEVWNQPVAGYRVLSLRPEDIGTMDQGGQTVHYASVRMKIYWADDEQSQGHVSSVFDISKTTDDETLDSFPGGDYVARLLKFKLFFDAPVELGTDGKIANAGKLIGQGLWSHQEQVVSIYSLNQSHPDFIWSPTTLYFSSGYGNPSTTLNRIRKIIPYQP